MAWRLENRLLVAVHGPKSPSNLEWQRFLTEAVERGQGAAMRILIVSHGGGPDGEQRKQLARAIGNSPAPTIVMTRSALIRGITSALTFFNRSMKAVDLDAHDEAFQHLELDAKERVRAYGLRTELEAELGIVTGRAPKVPR